MVKLYHLYLVKTKGMNTPSGSGSGTFEVLTLGLTLGNGSGTDFGASQCIPMGPCRWRRRYRWRLTLGVGIAYKWKYIYFAKHLFIINLIHVFFLLKVDLYFHLFFHMKKITYWKLPPEVFVDWSSHMIPSILAWRETLSHPSGSSNRILSYPCPPYVTTPTRVLFKVW